MNNSDSGQDSQEEKPFAIPKQIKDLRACQYCGLLLTLEQWNKITQCLNGCSADQTKIFSGIICVMKPSKSWVIKKLGNSKNIHPGLYAIDVQAE
ncbi:unnamed protein product [Paramecium pentaurelia]|uniref:Spt4/RpoE2 zinc finger domain-containing protein n=1 Tax=Paramecium pentaurelia TaxID=43138 RepID=A0A8S1UUJ8_9CILI|nr:unnamed protein product [Paramecium pentaurelia]